ncbi:MAG: homocysteine S-methyltransferase [Alphaproteobacteria bacterium]|jgi:S-methylmethionine-dependent homocysteine/selenocysteine methylase|nr:homocysteine S-methyltransferase [Alphaproteobacteria bacterium]
MNLSGRVVVLLDGGMGQELRKRRAAAPTPLWSGQVMADEPELVTAVHRDFIEAGAGVITANTYALTPERLARDGDPARLGELHRRALDAAHAARDTSGRAVRIAGCLGPLVASYRPDLVPDTDTCAASYRRLVDAQAARVDLFIAETLSTVREAGVATAAARPAGLEVWTSLTVRDDDGTRLRSGEPVRDGAAAALDAGASAVLINCSIPEAVTRAVGEIATLGCPFGAYANGFEPEGELRPDGTVDDLAARTDLGPGPYADHAMGWIEAGAAIVGGCCEVGPAHIAELARRLDQAGITPAGR